MKLSILLIGSASIAMVSAQDTFGTNIPLLAIVTITFQAIATSAIDTVFKQYGSISYSDDVLSKDIIEQLKHSISLSEQQQSHRGHITVDNNIVQRIKDAAGSECSIDDIIDANNTGGVKLQTRFINQSTQPHVDRYHHNGKVVDDDVMFVALDSNPEAYFTHGDSSIPTVAGRLIRFNGSIKHGTTFDGGNPIRLLGPFSTKNFASVGGTNKTLAPTPGITRPPEPTPAPITPFPTEPNIPPTPRPVAPPTGPPNMSIIMPQLDQFGYGSGSGDAKAGKGSGGYGSSGYSSSKSGKSCSSSKGSKGSYGHGGYGSSDGYDGSGDTKAGKGSGGYGYVRKLYGRNLGLGPLYGGYAYSDESGSSKGGKTSTGSGDGGYGGGYGSDGSGSSKGGKSERCGCESSYDSFGKARKLDAKAEGGGYGYGSSGSGKSGKGSSKSSKGSSDGYGSGYGGYGSSGSSKGGKTGSDYPEYDGGYKRHRNLRVVEQVSL